MSDSNNRINVLADGPFEVSGDLLLKRQDGSRRDCEETVYLCRCGASRNKPFCDGSHTDIGFEDPGVIAGGRLVGEAGNGPLKMTATTNGPLLLDGPVSLHTTDGGARNGARGALCRCGASATKPFCDGSHKAVGFVAD